MTTDRELLELAAKAVGFKSTGWISETHEWFQREGLGYDDSNDCQQLWNPLTDDGDALRLAVQLGIDIFPWQDKHHDREDLYKATRYAIVRKAAKIGATK